MGKKILLSVIGVGIGLSIGYGIIIHFSFLHFQSEDESLLNVLTAPFHKEVIGFLPYWLIDKAKSDYSDTITTLAYFSIAVDSNGDILKLQNSQEEEPGWYALQSRRINGVFSLAKKHGIPVSLVVFRGSNDAIASLISDPIPHAKNLAQALTPLLTSYGFSDINIDIEYTKEASEEARMHFTKFMKAVRDDLPSEISLSIDISPTDFIKKNLINPKAIDPIVDRIILMAYDFHFSGSFVSGPVAPLFGHETVAEFDTQVGLEKALSIIPSQKLILGIPLYGYSWETLGKEPRSAVIPGTGIVESTRTISSLLQSCATCSAKFDQVAKESYLIYKDQGTGTYHQVFFPDKQAIQEKIDIVRSNGLGGAALWALGYENGTILDPIKAYK